MSTNAFSLLPHDIKLHEISRFLTSADVLSFNEVLRKDERVYKKLPADYALKHALRTKYAHYKGIEKRLLKHMKYLLLDTVGDEAERAEAAAIELEGGSESDDEFVLSPFYRNKTHTKLAIKEFNKLCAFFCDPVNAIIFMYIPNLKMEVMREMEIWMDIHYEIYWYAAVVHGLWEEADAMLFISEETHDYIETIEFVRHVSTVDHQSVF